MRPNETERPRMCLNDFLATNVILSQGRFVRIRHKNYSHMIHIPHNHNPVINYKISLKYIDNHENEEYTISSQ